MKSRIAPRTTETIRPVVQPSAGGACGCAEGTAAEADRHRRRRRAGQRRVPPHRDRPRVGAAHVEAERRVPVGHQAGVGRDPQRPPVHAQHEVVDGARILAGEQQDDARDQHEERDQAARPQPSSQAPDSPRVPIQIPPPTNNATIT